MNIDNSFTIKQLLMKRDQRIESAIFEIDSFRIYFTDEIVALRYCYLK